MRMTAPAIGGAAIVLAVALVWFFQPEPERSGAPEPASTPSVPPAASARPPVIEAPHTTNTAPAAAPNGQLPVNAAPTPERSPLPGEAPATPMAQVLADRQQNTIIQNYGRDNTGVPPELAEGEREFSAEPIDGTWAPSAEAKLLSTFAEIPGLELIDLQVHCRSTMCRLQMTQPPAAGGGQLPFNILRDQVGMTPRWMMAVVEGSGPPGPPQSGAAPRPMRSIAYLWREGFAPERDTSAPTRPN